MWHSIAIKTNYLMQKYILTFKNQAKQLNFVLGYFFFIYWYDISCDCANNYSWFLVEKG